MPKLHSSKLQPSRLAELLIRCRAEKGFSLETVAAAIGVSHVTIANIETAKKAPRRTTRVLLEDFLRKHGYIPKAEAA
jgi:transcriptional regulator with XRE-family HTH domain